MLQPAVSVSVCKTLRNLYDNKRIVLDSGIHTLAHGHNKIIEFDTSGQDHEYCKYYVEQDIPYFVAQI